MKTKHQFLQRNWIKTGNVSFYLPPYPKFFEYQRIYTFNIKE